MSLLASFVEKIQNDFSKKRILVIGDLMVDEYIIGKVSRISPEAPVPILNFKERRFEGGGAANVAHNIRTLGARVLMSGVAAADEKGNWLRGHLLNSGINVDGVFSERNRPTTQKSRFATKTQQLIRVDIEDSHCILKETQEKLMGFLKHSVSECDAVVLSDYKKGLFSNVDFVQEIIKLCNENNVIVSIDSKSRDIQAFKSADFVKPNNLELEEAVGIKIEDEKSLDLAGKTYLKKSQAKSLVVTRGANGISVFVPNEERKDFASQAVQVFDVTGAGDTVISTITLGMVCGLSLCESVQLANLAASVVISKVGTATVTKEELIKRIKNEEAA